MCHPGKKRGVKDFDPSRGQKEEGLGGGGRIKVGETGPLKGEAAATEDYPLQEEARKKTREAEGGEEEEEEEIYIVAFEENDCRISLTKELKNYTLF